jgi:hypothetical protein
MHADDAHMPPEPGAGGVAAESVQVFEKVRTVVSESS